MRISQSRAVPWPQSIQKISQISQLQIAENFTVQLKSLMSKSLNAWIERNIHTIHHTGTILMYGDSNAWMGRKSAKFYAVYYYLGLSFRLLQKTQFHYYKVGIRQQGAIGSSWTNYRESLFTISF